MHAFVLADPKRCIGCRACEIACVTARLDVDPGRAMALGLPFVPRLCLVRESGVTMPVQCRQCEDAPCAAACPTRAIASNGRAVTVTPERCVGCKACLTACPIGGIGVGPQATGPARLIAHKCDLCLGSRTSPACVAVCPAGALTLFDPDTLAALAAGRRRKAGLSAPGDA